MNYHWRDTGEKEQELKADGLLTQRLEDACEAAAMRIYPVFTTFNIEMGDRMPTMRFVSQVIYELAIAALYDPKEGMYGWGSIYVESVKWDSSEDNYYAVEVGYHLAGIMYSDIYPEETEEKK